MALGADDAGEVKHDDEENDDADSCDGENGAATSGRLMMLVVISMRLHPSPYATSRPLVAITPAAMAAAA
jgi:hypothetical protein